MYVSLYPQMEKDKFSFTSLWTLSSNSGGALEELDSQAAINYRRLKNQHPHIKENIQHLSFGIWVPQQ